MSRNGETIGAAKEVAGPRSVTRLLRLFAALAKAAEGLTLAELNVALESPKSSLLNLLRPLASEGYLIHHGGRYRLGPAMFRLAADIISLWKLPKLIRPYMEELQTRCGETVYIAVLDREAQHATNVEVIESAHAVRYAVPVGASRTLYGSAAGRLLLAYEDDNWRENYVRSVKLKPVTSHTLSSRDTLRRQLAKIRKEGISVSVGEAVPGAAGIAAPVFGSDGKVLAALGVGAPSDRFESRLGEIRQALIDVAARASGALNSMGGAAL